MILRYIDVMSHFFQRAPAQQTEPKRFLEAILHKQHVLVTLPLGKAGASLYALAAMMGSGLVVAICSSPDAIRRNLDYFRAAGFQFPDVACLDGTQAPHEERMILGEVNKNRVKLLYTTPQRFSSLTFLEILVHQPVAFLIIEEAERFFPSLPGHALYQSLLQNGLGQLRQLPPLALMTPPLCPARRQQLSQYLNLPPFHTIQIPPLIAPVTVAVQCHLTEHQKFDALIQHLSGNPARGQTGRIDQPGAVLIQTAHPAQAQKLGRALKHYGFESVHVLHAKQPGPEQADIREQVTRNPHSILVNAGQDTRFWRPSGDVPRQIVFWSLPPSLDALFIQVFRQPQESNPNAPRDEHPMKALIFHTKEDYQHALQRLQSIASHTARADLAEQVHALRTVRRWILSDTCRLQSLSAYYQGTVLDDFPTCGRCDRCLESPSRRGRIRRWLRQWFF